MFGKRRREREEARWAAIEADMKRRYPDPWKRASAYFKMAKESFDRARFF